MQCFERTIVVEKKPRISAVFTAVIRQACARWSFLAGRASISRSNFQRKIWEKPLSRKIGERSMKRSWKSVKRNKSRKKENWRLFYHRGYSSTSVLFIYHSVLRFTKKVIRYWNFVVCCSNGRVREFIIFSCSKSSRGSFPYIFSEVLRGGLQKVCLCPSLSSSEHRCR